MTSSHHRKDDFTSFLRKSVPGRTCTCDLLIRNQPLFLLSYGDIKSAHGRTYTRTRPHLKRLSLLLDYMGFEAGRTPRCCPGPFLVPNQVSTLALSYPIEMWTCAPDSHRIMWTCKPRARLFALRTIKKIGSHSRIRTGAASFTTRNAAVTLCRESEKVPPRGDAPRSAGYRPAALLLSYRGKNGKRHPHQDLHLEPRPLEPAYAMLLHLAGF